MKLNDVASKILKWLQVIVLIILYKNSADKATCVRFCLFKPLTLKFAYYNVK